MKTITAVRQRRSTPWWQTELPCLGLGEKDHLRAHEVRPGMVLLRRGDVGPRLPPLYVYAAHIHRLTRRRRAVELHSNRGYANIGRDRRVDEVGQLARLRDIDRAPGLAAPRAWCVADAESAWRYALRSHVATRHADVSRSPVARWLRRLGVPDSVDVWLDELMAGADQALARHARLIVEAVRS